MYNTRNVRRMRLRERVQGFTAGAAVMGALMLGLPALIGAPSPYSDMDEFAGQFGVEIVWTDVTPCKPAHIHSVGCYSKVTPQRIYVSPNQTPRFVRDTVLHEIGHVLQYRLGMPLDECGADMFAHSFGSVLWGHCETA